MRPESKRNWTILLFGMTIVFAAIFLLSCSKEKIIIYGNPPGKVKLVYPPNSDSVFTQMPVFAWESLAGATQYQIQIAADPAFPGQILQVATNDTFYSHGSMLSDGRHYWRVRAQNSDNIWGDWSDATIWRFVVYGDTTYPNPNRVRLAAPPNSDSAMATTPVFYWRPYGAALAYQLQVSGSVDFIDNTLDIVVSDTQYAPSEALSNGSYYWRVRQFTAVNGWGNWADATIWRFRINDNSNYFGFLARIQTYGIPQDVLIEGNIAYVADGHADLTLVDISDTQSPAIIGNIELSNDDIAMAVWKSPTDNYAYVADMDGKIQIMDVSFPLNPYSPGNSTFGIAQNLEEALGVYYNDSLYIIGVSSGAPSHQSLNIYRMVYDPLPHQDPFWTMNEINLQGSGKGVWFDTMTVQVQYRDPREPDSVSYEESLHQFIYVASGQYGVQVFDVSRTHPFGFPDSVIELMNSPIRVGRCDTWSECLSIQTKGRFIYVADDRGGLVIMQMPDTVFAFDNPEPDSAHPEIIARINTSGRTKDLHIVGNYCFIADGSGGLKVIDISNPFAPVFLSAYTTPYAYGLWADESYIYVTDRDNGLMIFENRVF